MTVAYLLDTNLLSEPTKRDADSRVLAWLDQNITASGLPTPALMEISLGVEALPAGARRENLRAFLQATVDRFRDRLFVLDAPSALSAAAIHAARRREGQPVENIVDLQIAGIARAHRLAIVTRNVRDFAGLGIDLVNPWDGA